MPVNENAPIEITAFRWVPEFAQGVVRDLREAARAVRAQIGIRAHEDAGAAHERAHPADRRRALPCPLQPE